MASHGFAPGFPPGFPFPGDSLDFSWGFQVFSSGMSGQVETMGFHELAAQLGISPFQGIPKVGGGPPTLRSPKRGYPQKINAHALNYEHQFFCFGQDRIWVCLL